MRGARLNALAAVATVCAAALLAACDSGTKTVTVSSAPLTPQTTSTTPTSTAKTTSTATSTTPTTSTSGTTSTGATTTRSAPEPAFTQGETKAEGASGAAAVVRSRGYTPNDTSEYHSSQTLRVLVGTRTGSADGYGQQAFFFVDGRYLGTDTKEASATVKVVSQGDTEVTLAYPLYRKGDPLSSPSGGEARVTFQLNNGKLVPLGKIPPTSSSSGLSRQ
ncbi:MAG TPA: LppP/LprE family lipoprotein [Solirubrobacteraceae bacterium]